MLMGHPTQIIARSRENAPQGCFEGLTPVQVPVVMEERVACDSQVKEALAATLEVVQEIPQAGPHTFHRVAGHTCAIRVTPRILACAMVDRPMIIVGLGEVVDGVCIGEELCPAFHLGGNDGFDRRGAHVLEHFEIDLRGWRVLLCLVAALHQAQQGWAAHLGSGATAQLKSSLSRCAALTFDLTGQPFAARTLVALIRFYLVLQLAGRIQMVRLVDATIEYIDTPLRGPLLEVSSGGNVGGVQLQLPPAEHQQPCEGTQLALLKDRTGPVREHGKLLAQARGTVPTVAALQSVVALFARRYCLASTAWTRDAVGPAQLSPVIGSFLVILQVGYQMFHRVAPTGCEQPHYTDPIWAEL